MTEHTTNDILLYDEDTTLHTTHTDQDITSVQVSLQRDIDFIEAYAKTRAITFNPIKTVQQTFSNMKKPIGT